jgi:2-dehydropantoate 2-reductase
MNILVVGAGAIGQVYALHLARAGHAVSFFVKPQYADEVGAGLSLHRLQRRGHVTERLEGVGCLSDPVQVAAGRWDQVWLTLPSNALRGELARQVLAAVGDATVICLQPDIHDGAFVRSLTPQPQQVVQSLIPFISFQSPLPGQPGPAGIAFFLPPLTPALVAGEPSRAAAVTTTLKQAGVPARQVQDFARSTAAFVAMMQPLMAALEANGWDLYGLPASPMLREGLFASREAMQAAAAETGGSIWALRPLLWPLTWRLALPLLKHVFPFDLQVYLRFHYSKVGVQTRLMLDSYIELGAARRMPVSSLQNLRLALPEPAGV